jgi:hypothetical protein
MKIQTEMNIHTSSEVVAHPAGACLVVAYRLVLVVMVVMSESGRKHSQIAQLGRLAVTRDGGGAPLGAEWSLDVVGVLDP